ncbi:NUDIX hydrolase [Kitasatospora camelliae]|uniref:NUDIX hydrolase n=1 Tax=Kitasatospora camelliae TaxID=3156397 RepID=A0AAU8JQ74_9ACTN
MSERPPAPAGPRLLEVGRIRLVRSDPPVLSAEQRTARDGAWAAAVRANPALFDGPVVACSGLAWDGPGALVLGWVRTTYRYYAMRRVPGAAVLPSLSVGVVQPTEDGRLVLGRMSASTSAPGRWQPPGGCLEPPDGDRPMDLAEVRRNAARELVEETGVDTPPEDLALWRVTVAANGNVGVLFRAAPLPAGRIEERFAALVAAERAAGRDPEFQRLALVRSPAELPLLAGPHADYLELLLHAFHTEPATTAPHHGS